MSPRARAGTRIGALVLGAALIIGAAPFVGPPLVEDSAEFIFWQLRVPRVLMAVLVGGTLSLVGATYQVIFFNPLATPSTVGTTAGATFGALIAIVFGVRSMVWGELPVLTLSAFLGALGVSAAVTFVALSRRARNNDIILAGIASSLAVGSASSAIQFSADETATLAAVRWSLGYLPQVGYRGIVLLLPIAAITALGLIGLSRSLDVLATGEELAHSRGMNVPLVRAIAIGCGALGVAGCVAWCGPIAFVELMVPHVVRLTLGSNRRVLLPMSLVVGGAFLALCDTIARTVIAGAELPVGVITAALGAPTLVYLIARQYR
ncbi:iron ABC transporter permease [Sorangium sp. So ce590]|uniref:FecCD family ABC transporter permease n=1 Tax=Sorangium sp. So ce590 TaxID=3133317 RepID=UPI003F5FFF0E